jgi:hypothetical protein
VQSPPDGPLRGAPIKYKTTVQPEWPVFPACFISLTAASLARERAAHARASPPRGRSDGRHPVKVPASLPPPWQGKQRDKRSPARERARTRTCSRKPIKACHGGHEVSRHSFPVFSNCHPGPCGLKVHHEIRDPKALCASKNEASKAHSLGALLNSDSATRRSAESSPKDTQCATSANHKRCWTLGTRPRVTRGRIPEAPPHHSPPAAAQDFASSKIASA